MKKIYIQELKSLIACSLLFLFSIISFTVFAQEGVGINTTEPRTALEVAGDMYIDGTIKIGEVNRIQNNEAASFLVQTQDNFIEELDASQGDGLVIAYFQEYVLKDMQGDWVKEFNTNIDTSKYVITIISAYFNQELKMTSEVQNFTIPYASAYEKDSTWRIKADYPSADPRTIAPGKWVISTLILSKNFSKVLGQQNVPMGGGTSGTAGTVIIN